MFKLSFKQEIYLGYSITLFFVLISAVASLLSVRSISESNRWVEHTQDVVRKAEQIEIELINAETGLRGFIITEKDYYKLPYNNSIEKIIPLTTELSNLVIDNRSQNKLMDSIAYYASAKVNDMRQIMAQATRRDFNAAKTQILTDKGRDYKIAFMRLSKAFIGNELSLLQTRKENNEVSNNRTKLIVLLSSIIIFGLVLFLLRYIKKTFDQQKKIERQILLANGELKELSQINNHNNWLLSGSARVNEAMRGQQEVNQLANNILESICSYSEASIGTLFIADDNYEFYTLAGTYAIAHTFSQNIRFGQGLVGQTAREQKTRLVTDLPQTYFKLESSLGETTPSAIYLIPIVFEKETVAVIELGFLTQPEKAIIELLNNISENIGIALNSSLAHLKLQQLFEQTQQQAEELTSQQEELRVTNEELLLKSDALQASEEELRVQQEELQQVNSQLEEKAQLLEEQNFSINQANEAIRLKAEELVVSSRYKSEFLANMSHELRTPLNSILILARILKDNKHQNLNEEQIKYAGVIHNAGSDLLTLINDILDLSKIESGNVDLHLENISPQSVKEDIDALFSEMALQKAIDFKFVIANNAPKQLYTDQTRLQQIIKNLLSNAFKFTPEQGSITVTLGKVDGLDYATTIPNDRSPIYIAVKDSGIGIAKEKQQLIFEAFKQEDGSTSRKYGGTGLGLSISRQLANLLKGEIQLHSTVGEGSTFTIFLPQTMDEKMLPLGNLDIKTEPLKIDQHVLNSFPSFQGKKRLLIVEDDRNFAEVIKAYAIEKGFEPLLAFAGDEGLKMAKDEKPDAIVLDVMLPVMDGWAILKSLKASPATMHIPVHMMSAGDEYLNKAEEQGAIGFLKKPFESHQLDQAFDLFSHSNDYIFNQVLLVEDQLLQSNSLKEQLQKRGANVVQAFSGSEARDKLSQQTYDCIILDLKLPDISGFELLDEIKSQSDLKEIPIIINTAMELDKDQMAHIMKYTQAMVLKTNKSNERLLDEVSLFMNKLKQDIPSVASEKGAQSSPKIEKALDDKTILVVDDDMRNIFALSSILQDYQIEVIIANNGREAIEKLNDNERIDLILMDIMMPEMDGYEAMRKIRLQKQYTDLPIIALTAKAMKNDREKCLEAGANDYISKPVDVDKLLSMLRVWLS